MDTLAHGILIYGISRVPRPPLRPWWLLVGFGMLPDAVWIAGSVFGVPFDALYRVSHSLVIWGILSLIAFVLVSRRAFAITWPWGLHILVDIPGHVSPPLTPLLWPVSDITIRGWWNWLDLPWLVGTYAALGVTLALVEWRRRVSRTVDSR